MNQPVIDKRPKLIEEIVRRLKSGKRLNETEVREYLYLARDYTLLYMTQKTVSGALVEKDRISAYNCLQNAVERHELYHRDICTVEKAIDIATCELNLIAAQNRTEAQA